MQKNFLVPRTLALTAALVINLNGNEPVVDFSELSPENMVPLVLKQEKSSSLVFHCRKGELEIAFFKLGEERFMVYSSSLSGSVDDVVVDGEVSPNLLKQFGYWTHSVHHTVDGPVNTKNKEFSIIGSEFSLSKKSSLFLKMTIEDFSSEKNILVLRRAPNSDNWDFCFSEKSVLSLIEKAKGRGAAKAVTGSNGEGAPELETGKSEK